MLTEAQLQARKAGIGGSDVAAILGLSPWRSPLDIYLDKIGEGTPQADSKHLRRGSALEPLILARFQEIHGSPVAKLPMLQSIEHPWMLANLDGGVPESGAIVECKKAFSDKGWGDSGSDDVPPYYHTQVAHYFAVVPTAEICYMPVLFGDGLDWAPKLDAEGETVWTPIIADDADFRIYRIYRDASFVRDVIAAEHGFWHGHVLARVPPRPANAEDALKLWQRDTGKAVEVDQVLADKVERYRQLKEQEKATKESLDFLRDEIAISFADSATITFNGVPLATYKSQEATRIDSDLLRKLHPAIAAECSKKSISRVLRLK